jgi:hypothetical protein
MSLTCPCCRASNETPTCRRCKADLRLMQQCEDVRAASINSAKHLLKNGQLAEAEVLLAEAAQLRPGADVQQYQATLALLAGDFATALSLLPHETATL